MKKKFISSNVIQTVQFTNLGAKLRRIVMKSNKAFGCAIIDQCMLIRLANERLYLIQVII